MAEAKVTRRLAAILAADVVGYSRLMGVDEVGTLSRLEALRAEVIDPRIAAHQGRIVKVMGDGLLVEFASVVDAVECAVALQRELAERNADEPEARRIVLRIGVNLGDVIVADGDIFGDGVNVAARLEGLAPPGGVTISRAARDQIRDKLDLRLEDQGEVEVKNIARPVRVFRVAIEETAGAPAGAAAAAPRLELPSIAVLPFTNLSQDKEQEYFVDGITEDLITELSRLPALFVIARGSSFAYKGQAVDVRRAGQELGARYVVEGSVRKAGKRVRISVELADAATGTRLWGERYDRDLEDIFALQDEITRTIVAALPSRLEAADLERAKHKPPDTMAAYDYLLRGKDLHHRGSREANAEALRLLGKATELDPNYAQAHAWRACTLGQAWARGYGEDRDLLLKECRAEAERSMALDDQDCECHRILSDIHILQGDFDQAWALHEKAFHLNPNDPRIVSQRGELLTWLGRAEEAVEWLEKAIKLDPRAADSRAASLGAALHAAGRYADAVEAFKRVPKKSPAHHAYLAADYAQLGRDEAAQAEVREVLELKPDFSVEGYVAGLPYRDEADRERHKRTLLEAGLPA